MVDLVAATVKVHNIRTSVSYLQLVDLILTNDVFEVYDVLVLESGEDFDLSEGTLTESLVFEGSHFFDGNLLSTYTV